MFNVDIPIQWYVPAGTWERKQKRNFREKVVVGGLILLLAGLSILINLGY